MIQLYAGSFRWTKAVGYSAESSATPAICRLTSLDLEGKIEDRVATCGDEQPNDDETDDCREEVLELLGVAQRGEDSCGQVSEVLDIQGGCGEIEHGMRLSGRLDREG
jgi:hypothetical protein